MTVALFPFQHYWWFYAGFTAFVLVLSYFAIPSQYQHRVLFYGILGALVCRGLFIALGSVLMQIHWIVLLFGAFLIFVGPKMVWLNQWYGGKFPISYSLGVIATVIAASIILSFLFPKRRPAAPSVTGGQEEAP